MLALLELPSVADTWLATLWRASWQGAVLITIVWAICRAFPRMSPSVSCWLWRLALLKMLLAFVPFGTLDLAWLPSTFAPRQPIAAGADESTASVEASVTTHASTDNSESASLATTAPEGAPTTAGALEPRSAAAGASHASKSLLWPTILFLLWAAVIASFIVAVARRVYAARRWRSEWRMITDPKLLALNERLSVGLGLFQPPVLFASESCESPLVFGVFRCAVVLPARLVESANTEQLIMILSHELAHIRRYDLVANWFTSFVSAMFFFHPGVWLALRESRLAQEIACDELAMRQTGVESADYGKLLVDLATEWPSTAQPLLAVGMVESFQLFLKRRLVAMGIERRNSRIAWLCSMSVLGASLLGLLPWRLVARADEPAQAVANANAATATATAEARSGDAETASASANVEDKSGRYTVTVDRVRRIESPSHDAFPNGFPLFAAMGNMSKNGSFETKQDRNGSTAAGGFAGGTGGSYSYHSPNLVLDVKVSEGRSSKPRVICNVVGKFSATDDEGNEVNGSQTAPWQKLLVDGVDYNLGAGRTAVHFALPASSRGSKYLKSVDGELLVAEGTVAQLEFAGRDLTSKATKGAGDISAKVEAITPGAEGIDVRVAVSPQQPDIQQSPIGGIPNAQELEKMMKRNMMMNCPGRVTVVMVDTDGKLHYGKTDSQSGGGSAGARAGGSPGGSAGNFSYSTSGESNGVKWQRGGGSSGPAPNPRTGLAEETYHFPALPSGVEVKSITCVVSTCTSEPKPLKFHFEDVPLPR